MTPRVLALAAALISLAAAPPQREDLTAARALVEAGRAVEAKRALAKTRSAEGLLLRSTASFLLGEDEPGRKDLEQALKLDPALRQGWLNHAALALADGRPDNAYADLVRARDLDPAAADNDLNLGAVELVRGRLEPASRHFAAHLARAPTADAHFLVASNYARAGYSALAAEHLTRAVALDERSRARALADPNFEAVAASPPFQRLWTTDAWQPPAGARIAKESFPSPYAPEGQLLRAALDALLEIGEPHESRVEATSEWALIWTPTYRIKLAPEADPARASIELTSVSTTLGEPEWRERSTRLFRAVTVALLRAAK